MRNRRSQFILANADDWLWGVEASEFTLRLYLNFAKPPAGVPGVEERNGMNAAGDLR